MYICPKRVWKKTESVYGAKENERRARDRALEHKRMLLHYSFDIIIAFPFAAIGVDVVGMHFLFDALSGDAPLDREEAGISLGRSGRGLTVHSASMVRRCEIKAFSDCRIASENNIEASSCIGGFQACDSF